MKIFILSTLANLAIIILLSSSRADTTTTAAAAVVAAEVDDGDDQRVNVNLQQYLRRTNQQQQQQEDYDAVALIDNDDQGHRSLQSTPIFLEKDGYVVIEMESIPKKGEWKLEKSKSGYTGSGYYRFDGNTIYTGPPGGRMTVKIRITTPGKYAFKMRSTKFNEDGTLSNDCYTKMIGFDKEDIKTYMPGDPYQWSWSTVAQVGEHSYLPDFELDAKDYTFEISGRAKDFALDRIAFHTPKAKDVATNKNTPESKRAGSGSGGGSDGGEDSGSGGDGGSGSGGDGGGSGGGSSVGGDSSGGTYINCGAGSAGIWKNDETYVTGGSTYKTNRDIKNASGDLERMYQSERWGKSFTFKIPVTSGKKYTIDFYFAEIYQPYHEDDAREFDILVNGVTRFNDIDVFDKANAGDTGVKYQYKTGDLGSNTLSIEFASSDSEAKCSGLHIYEY